MNRTTNYATATDFIDNDNNWSAQEYNNANKDNAALDAHWGASKTYDYFFQKHNRNSFDNNGSKIKSYVHFSTFYDNAFWDSVDKRMVYGDGGSIFSPLTSIDVVSHEIGHGVCSSTAGLIYQKESGAINEGLSDVWGAMVKQFAEPTKQTYLIGQEISLGGGALRSMSNPNSFGQPNTYGGTFWYDQNCTPSNLNDYCGVHRNSGVFNHWFYILAEGKAGTNDFGNSYNVSGISKEKAAKIVYRAETVYFSATTNYLQAKDLTIQAAKDLYGTNSVESATVCQSWYAVGVGSNNCAIIPIVINGDNVICNSSTNYNYTITNLVAGSTLNWSVSTNSLILVTSNNTSITVKPINSTFNGSATITANVGGSITTKTIWIGKPTIIFKREPAESETCDGIKYHYVPFEIVVPPGTSLKFNYLSPQVQYLQNGNIYTFAFLKNYNGPFTVIATATNICGSTIFDNEGEVFISDCTTLANGTTAFINSLEKDYDIYPNPSNDYINIILKPKKDNLKTESVIFGEVFDLQGQSKLKIEIKNDKSFFSVVGLKKGIYILKIYIDNQIESHQIVVE